MAHTYSTPESRAPSVRQHDERPRSRSAAELLLVAVAALVFATGRVLVLSGKRAALDDAAADVAAGKVLDLNSDVRTEGVAPS